MNNNYIPNKTKKALLISVARVNEMSVVTKEKRVAIYATFLLLLIMSSMTIFFIGQNIFLDKISISIFIISCLLLIRMSGPTKQN